MKREISDLLKGFSGKMKVSNDRGVALENLAFDSRESLTRGCFVAIKGTQVDGHKFIEKAVENGAEVIVAETEKPEIWDGTWVQVTDSAAALAYIAANWYGRPSEKLTLVGITGTNGKTTCVTLLHQLFSVLGKKAGLIGTVETRIGQEVLPSTHTTPDAIKVQALMAKMVAADCLVVFMEVSSHAVHQKRVAGLHFSGAVFTNITHDHLDYHGTFKEYIKVKKAFFDALPKTAFALTNVDDKNGHVMLQNTVAKTYTYGLKRTANYKSKVIENSLNGLHLLLDGAEIFTRIIGFFNACNLTAVYSVARLLNIEKMEALTAISGLKGAAGRFETIAHPSLQHCIGIVDYAHTPDALEKVLETIKDLKNKGSQVITVIGCGGDRDSSKRPKMAKIAAKMSNQVILTSDNPRTEEPYEILHDMESGLDSVDLKKTLTIENREQAIKTACRLAEENTIILVAGKGHETYQEIEGVKHDFDDRKMLAKYLVAE